MRSTLAALRDRGAEPSIVPTMGSRGSPTPEQQVHVLAELSETGESLGVEIRVTLDTRSTCPSCTTGKNT